MTGITAGPTGSTVRPRLTLVNRVVSVDRRLGTEQADEDAPGRRLERYIKARWTRKQGGIVKLASEIGSSTETIYAWFRGETEPNMSHLRALAEKLGVRRSVLVAVLDGDPLPGETADPESFGDRLRLLEATVARLVEPALDGRETQARRAPGVPGR